MTYYCKYFVIYIYNWGVIYLLNSLIVKLCQERCSITPARRLSIQQVQKREQPERSQDKPAAPPSSSQEHAQRVSFCFLREYLTMILRDRIILTESKSIPPLLFSI